MAVIPLPRSRLVAVLVAAAFASQVHGASTPQEQAEHPAERPSVPAFASASLDDTAKILAGLPPSSGSPLEPLTADPGWKSQSAKFSQTWQRFHERQLSRARIWADRELPAVRAEAPVLYYTFSGPDIVYASAFFPDCPTYVLCGLEPVGTVPDLLALGPAKLGPTLGRLYGSLKNVLTLSFFITKDMGSDFHNNDLPGTTPVLITFLARLGKTVRRVDLVVLDRDGNERLRDAACLEGVGADTTAGVKITFDSGSGTPAQTLYYFTADISNTGLEKNPGFANFCRKLEPGAGLVKAASYLMHTEPFSKTRDFLMERCKFVLQDDTGIPAAVFNERRWQVQPYGRYVRPIDMFRGYYQKELAKLYACADRVPLEFGVGYYHRVNECSVILASRDANSVAVTAPPPKEPAVPAATPAPTIVVAANRALTESKSSKKSLAELENEELRIRQDETLTKPERMRKLHEIWKQQLAAMGKTSA